MNYLLHLLVSFEIYAVVALGLNIVAGYSGLLTLAHAGYFAIGGYGYALLTLVHQWSFLPAVAASAALAAVASLAISIPAWRLRGDFFVLVTLSVQVLLFSIVYHGADTGAPLGSLSNLGNGAFGIAGVPKPEVFSLRLTHPWQFLMVATLVTGACAALCWRIGGSPWVRALVAMRDDELAARSVGKHTRVLKVQAVGLGSALAAVSGALYAAHVGFIDPSAASLEEGILMLSMVAVGGFGNFRGPVLGAAILVLLPEALRLMHLPDAQAASLRMGLYGALLVLLMHWRPQGLLGVYRYR